MLRFITIMFEMLVPIFITFHVLPKVWKMIFGQEEKKPKLRQLGHRNPPPPPKSRRVEQVDILKEKEKLARMLDSYEVRGGRIVKKDNTYTWEDEQRFRRLRDGKMTEDDKRYFNRGMTIKDPSKKGHVKVVPDKPKKNKFKKGVDPDFL